MNKKIISFIICFILLFSIITCAFASTDISKIQPDNYNGTIVIVGDTYYNYPKEQVTVIHNDTKTNTTIVIPTFIPIIEESTTNNNQSSNEQPKNEDETPQEGSYAPTKMAEDIFILVNQARMDAEVNTVSYNNKELQDAADLRAKEIVEKFAHDRPDGTSCFTAFPKDYVVAGENIIQADEPIATANNLMKSWMESEGHKANILNPDFTQMAIGIYEKDGVVYAAQLFIG